MPVQLDGTDARIMFRPWQPKSMSPPTWVDAFAYEIPNDVNLRICLSMQSVLPLCQRRPSLCLPMWVLRVCQPCAESHFDTCRSIVRPPLGFAARLIIIPSLPAKLMFRDQRIDLCSFAKKNQDSFGSTWITTPKTLTEGNAPRKWSTHEENITWFYFQ